MFKISLLRSCTSFTTVYKIRLKRSDQNTELCLGSEVTARLFSQGNNLMKITSSVHSNIITLNILNINVPRPGDSDHLLPGLVVPDDSLQVARQGVHDSLHVTFQSLDDNICQW